MKVAEQPIARLQAAGLRRVHGIVGDIPTQCSAPSGARAKGRITRGQVSGFDVEHDRTPCC